MVPIRTQASTPKIAPRMIQSATVMFEKSIKASFSNRSRVPVPQGPGPAAS